MGGETVCVTLSKILLRPVVDETLGPGRSITLLYGTMFRDSVLKRERHVLLPKVFIVFQTDTLSVNGHEDLF